jgi:serine/threonine-protein phosphatase CPPED1
MTFTRNLIGLCFAGALAAQSMPAPPIQPKPKPVAVPPTFIQMSDPQFGMYDQNKSFSHETANFEYAIAAANRMKPQFVVVTGDLVNQSSSTEQVAEYKRIAARLDPAIRLYSVPGNHDVGNQPTPESLARYRESFGPDYYTFRAGEIEGIVLDSNLEAGAEKVPDEAAKMEKWFREQLEAARRAGVKRVIVFQHIPLFLKSADEPDQYFNVPREVRRRYLALLHEYGVEQVFAGHLHNNSEARDGNLTMITTGPVGMPLDGCKSGMRLVQISESGIAQKYYEFGDLPQ